MRYSFDDQWFGLTKDGRKLDERLVLRPDMPLRDWYMFAGTLARALNERVGLS